MNPAPCTMRLPAVLSSVRVLCEFATSALDGRLDDRTLAVQLALEEILVNIVRYGYGDGEDGFIEVTVSVDGRALSVVVSDAGKPFDPLQHQTPDLDAALEDRSIGGLGIFLAKAIASTATHSRDGERNTIRLRFDDLVAASSPSSGLDYGLPKSVDASRGSC